MKNYDLVILNNCPAFYKINLYNEIARHRSIFVVFIGYYNQVLIDSDYKRRIHFPYTVLNETELSKRSVIRSFFKLLSLFRHIRYNEIIFGGYVDPEFVALSFLTSKKKNTLQTESGGETKLKGIRFILKKLFLTRYSKALASGKIHAEMLRKMNFKGEILITKGVGLMEQNKESQHIERGAPLKFLYVGRLTEVKNLEFLINAFNDNRQQLTIIGKGELEDNLRAIAKDNIKFVGFVENKDLYKWYSSHDVFVLPSLSEAWGLVVEEALFHKCVLLLSSRVGCIHELLLDPQTGVSFDPENLQDLQNSVAKVIENYDGYYKNVKKFSIEEKDREQIAAYL